MKKLLGLLAVLAIAFPANADVLKNVDVKGDIQTIASDISHNNAAGTTYVRGTSARVLAGLSADLVEDVTANLMFQYANVWGHNQAAGRTTQDYWNNVTLVEANVELHNLFCALEAKVGRQFYGDEDSAVIYFGPNHYNAEFNGYTRSIDAAKITYADDVKVFTVMAGRTNATIANPAAMTGFVTPVDASVFGADFRLNLADDLKFQVYGYDVQNFFMYNGVRDEDAGFYGAKLALDGPVRLGVEYARNFGGDRLVKEHKDTGHMAKVDVAADMDKVTARGAYYYANEHFFALGNYTPGLLVGHDLGGNIYNYSTEGVSLFNVGFDVKPAEKWTVSLDGYSFQGRTGHHAATWEADLTAKYAHNEYVELFAGVGYAKYGNDEMFNVISGFGDTYKESIGKDNVKGQLGMLIKF